MYWNSNKEFNTLYGKGWIVTLDVLKSKNILKGLRSCNGWIVTLDVLKYYKSCVYHYSNKLNSNIRCIEIFISYIILTYA